MKDIKELEEFYGNEAYEAFFKSLTGKDSMDKIDVANFYDLTYKMKKGWIDSAMQIIKLSH